MIFKTVGDIIDLSLVKNLIQKSNWSKSLFSLNTFHVLTSYNGPACRSRKSAQLGETLAYVIDHTPSRNNFELRHFIGWL